VNDERLVCVDHHHYPVRFDFHQWCITAGIDNYGFDQIEDLFMNELEFRILSNAEISPELRKQIKELDSLAFNEPLEDELKDVQWSSADAMAVGFIDGLLVSQLCLVYRQVKAGAISLLVVGVGGVATHPKYRRKGYSSQLLAKIRDFLSKEQRANFGLLICDEKLETFYGAAGWQKVANSLDYWQENQRRTLKTPVMILSLSDQEWPTGNIDIRGLPW
jgi:GNAT superfamily N-acetyltransferase